MSERKPDPRKAIRLGKRGKLPAGVKTCTKTIHDKWSVPEMRRGRFFHLGMCFVPLEAYVPRPANKRGPHNGRWVTYRRK